MKSESLELPPAELARYVGGEPGPTFIEQGLRLYRCLLASLPPSFSLQRKRILDFGCGVGRVLRHFAPNTENNEIWGCDISAPCIKWLREHFGRPFHFRLTSESPPLPFEDGYFDLIYSLSVFTHLTTTWEAWLHELRRVLKPQGHAVITFLNRTAHEYYEGRPFDEESVGMMIRHPQRSWEFGGPAVYHSNKWIVANWSKVLRIEALFREGMIGFQSVVVARNVENEAGGELRVYQPFPYCEYRSDFKGDLHLDGLADQNWWTSTGIPIRPGQRLTGWFISKGGPIARIEGRVDGMPVQLEGKIHLIRDDVRRAHSAFKHSLFSGFELNVDFSELQPGGHQLELLAVDAKDNRLAITAPIAVGSIG